MNLDRHHARWNPVRRRPARRLAHRFNPAAEGLEWRSLLSTLVAKPSPSHSPVAIAALARGIHGQAAPPAPVIKVVLGPPATRERAIAGEVFGFEITITCSDPNYKTKLVGVPKVSMAVGKVVPAPGIIKFHAVKPFSGPEMPLGGTTQTLFIATGAPVPAGHYQYKITVTAVVAVDTDEAEDKDKKTGDDGKDDPEITVTKEITINYQVEPRRKR